MTPEQDLATEDALFDNAVDEGNATPVSEPEALPSTVAPEQPSEPATTEAAAPPDATAKPVVDDDAPLVPSWRLKEITEERRAAQAERDVLKRERDQALFERQEFQRRLAQLEKPAAAEAEEPDPLLDPKGFREAVRREAQQEVLRRQGEASMRQAKRAYGEEFDQAHATALQLINPQLRDHIQKADDPGEALVAWFRRLKWDHEVGNDPVAYKKRIIEEDRKARLSDPEFRKVAIETWRGEAPAQSNGRPNVQLPPSLSGASRSNAAIRSLQTDQSDDDLWDSTTN